MRAADIPGLEAASRALGGAMLGPRELAAVLGFDPITVLNADERRTVGALPFAPADLERARASGEMLVLRLPRAPEGPLSILTLATRLGGIDPAAHKGVGYSLRPEWTIDEQPFAAEETSSRAGGWCAASRPPRRSTAAYRAQDALLGPTRPGARIAGVRSRSRTTRSSGSTRTANGCSPARGTGPGASRSIRAMRRSASSERKASGSSPTRAPSASARSACACSA